MFSVFLKLEKSRAEEITQHQLLSGSSEKKFLMEAPVKHLDKPMLQKIATPAASNLTQVDHDLSPPAVRDAKDTTQLQANCELSRNPKKCHECQKEEDDGGRMDQDWKSCSSCLTSLCGDCSQNACTFCFASSNNSDPKTRSSHYALCKACRVTCDDCEDCVFHKDCIAEHISACSQKTPRQRAVAVAARNIRETEAELLDAKKQLEEVTNRIKSLELQLASRQEDKVAAEKDLVQETKALETVNQLLAGFIEF